MLMVLALMVPATGIRAQEIARETRETGIFTGVDAGGAFQVYLSQADESKVIIETEAKDMDKVSTIVNDGMLEISSKGIRKSKVLNVYITSPDISELYLHGAAALEGLTPLRGEKLKIRASGAASIEMEVYFDQMVSSVSGAATLRLSGEADIHDAEVSGAGNLEAGGLHTDISRVSASGASNANVRASEEAVSTTSGAGKVTFSGKPEKMIINTDEVLGTSENIRYKTNEDGDTTSVNVAGLKIRVVERDSTTVSIGNRTIIINEEGHVRWRKTKKRKFNGHWAGLDLGINGYLTRDNNMKFPPEDEYMDLRMEKSIQVGLNIYEQNVALSRNQEWGMLTGIGLLWNNYRFRRPVTLLSDSSALIGLIDQDISVKKSKLAITYLQVPLLFEWQNQTLKKKHSFHVNIGIVLGVRLWSWQKKYYNELNKDHMLAQYDPESGKYISKYEKTSPGKNKLRNNDDFHLQPFKADASVRIGWGFIKLFASYNLVPMFRVDKGPELNQFSAGISLIGW
jgi:hypothetical protein